METKISSKGMTITNHQSKTHLMDSITVPDWNCSVTNCWRELCEWKEASLVYELQKRTLRVISFQFSRVNPNTFVVCRDIHNKPGGTVHIHTADHKVKLYMIVQKYLVLTESARKWSSCSSLLQRQRNQHKLQDLCCLMKYECKAQGIMSRKMQRNKKEQWIFWTTCIKKDYHIVFSMPRIYIRFVRCME